jgi:hypothetical protein
MKKYEQIELITTTKIEIDDIHDPISLLKQVQGFFPLLSLDKLNSRVIKFPQYYRYLVLGYSQLLVIVLVECIVLIECAAL